MKKFFLLLVAALPLVFTSCGDDDDNQISLNKTEVTLNYGATDSSLKCNLKNPVWGSSNEFVATVDSKGEIKAHHVGTAKISATADGQTATVLVTVNPTNDNFRMPILSFGQSQDQIASQMKAWEADGVYLVEGATIGLQYLTGGLLPGYGYNFVNNKLQAATLTLTEEQGDEGDVYVFVGQRYKKYGEGSNEADGYDYEFYCNADNVADATIIVEVDVDYDTMDYSVLWTENNGTKTRATGVFNTSDFNEVRSIARSLSKAARR